MADDEVVNQEVEYPVEDHVSSAAGRVTEQLFRYQIAERTVEKINDFSDYLRPTIHLSSNCGCKGNAFF